MFNSVVQTIKSLFSSTVGILTIVSVVLLGSILLAFIGFRPFRSVKSLLRFGKKKPYYRLHRRRRFRRRFSRNGAMSLTNKISRLQGQVNALSSSRF